MALEWSEEYATEVDSIDRQHKKLFQYVNNIEECIHKEIFEGTKIDEILDFLGTYTKMHFTHEEFCMVEKKCPVAEKNKKAHDSFLSFYTDLSKNYYDTSSAREKEKLIRKLHHMAEDWLVSHICNIDTHLKSCVN
ncbi:MAG: bacteriohemerythrin [Cyclobacteriaceae bacterium]|nr:bacteriohemerythrin [Cyclobacteriaceae bacterium]